MIVGSLTLVRGNDTDVTLNVTQAGCTDPYDLTSCTLVFTARDGSYYSPVLFTVTASLTDPTAGVAVLSFVPSNTADLSDKPYYFDIVLTSAASKVTTMMSGTLLIRPA